MNISYKNFKKKFYRVLNRLFLNHQPIFIIDNGKPRAVLISYKDYISTQETMYLLKSQKNASRLVKAVVDFSNNRNFIKHSLID